jgi:uncharacterized protein with HEPN domain
MSRDTGYLKDILQSARLIQFHVRGLDRDAFYEDITAQRAVLFDITVIGEAVKQLSKQFRESHPDVPWSEIARMRDRVIHGYRRIDLQEIWNTATVDVPALIAQLEPLVPPEDA